MDLFRVFFLNASINLSHLALISPMKNGLKTYSNRVSNAFFTKGYYSNRGSNARFKRENLFEPLFPARTARGRFFQPRWHPASLGYVGDTSLRRPFQAGKPKSTPLLSSFILPSLPSRSTCSLCPSVFSVFPHHSPFSINRPATFNLQPPSLNTEHRKLNTEHHSPFTALYSLLSLLSPPPIPLSLL